MYCISACACSQEKARTLDSLFAEYSSKGLNGTVLVAEKGKVIFHKSYGLANAEWNISSANEAKYLIGSLSKQFVAVLVLQLVQENKLSLSDKILKYVPGITGDRSDMTVHQLLSHTSGMPHFNAMEDFLNAWQKRYSREEWLAKLLALPQGKPGTYHYSGPGYFLLALLVEKLRGMPLSNAYRKYIFEPAGMRSSSSVEDRSASPARLASGYIVSNTGLSPARYRDPSTMAGAGDIITTAHDYFLYDSALRNGVLLNRQSLSLLLKPYVEAEGYSLSFTKYLSPERKDTSTLVFFTGRLSGYSSLAYHAWEDDKLIVTFYNVEFPEIYDVADKAFRLLYRRPRKQP